MKLVIVGAGGFGRETLDVVEALNRARPDFELVGVLDDAPTQVNVDRLTARRVAYLGPIDRWLASNKAAVVVAIGTPSARRSIVDRIDPHEFYYPTLVHPQAVVGSEVQLGRGAVVCSGVQISTNVRIGNHVHLNPNATIGHDSVLDDFVSVNPAATISGECVVASGTLVGAAAVVLQGLHLGERSLVGAAACVTRDVGADVTVKGVPAR